MDNQAKQFEEVARKASLGLSFVKVADKKGCDGEGWYAYIPGYDGIFTVWHWKPSEVHIYHSIDGESIEADYREEWCENGENPFDVLIRCFPEK